MSQCTARSKRTGERCGAKAMVGKAVCYHHGGKNSGRPIKTGAYSKYKLNRLAAAYDAALNDPELLSLRDDVAVAGVLTAEAIEKYDAQEGCRMCRVALGHFQKWAGAEDENARKKALSDLLAALRAGAEGYGAKEEAVSMQEHKRKLSETEAKRLGLLQQYVTAKELMVLFAQVAVAIRETVSNQTERARLVQRIDGLIDANERVGS